MRSKVSTIGGEEGTDEPVRSRSRLEWKSVEWVCCKSLDHRRSEGPRLSEINGGYQGYNRLYCRTWAASVFM